MKKLTEKRRGAVAPLVAVSMTVLLSFVAIAIDGGLLFDRHQQSQAAADAAAFAAAEYLFANYPLDQGTDPQGKAKQRAIDNAKANGFTDVTVNIPPQSGPFAGLTGYAEVIVRANQRRFFSSIFGSQDIAY